MKFRTVFVDCKVDSPCSLALTYLLAYVLNKVSLGLIEGFAMMTPWNYFSFLLGGSKKSL